MWFRHISSAYLRERELYDGQFLRSLLSNLKPSYIFCLGVLTLYTETNWMNSTSREIRSSIFSRFLNRRYRCCLISCFCYLGSERQPALSTICLFGCLACVWRFFVVCHLSIQFSAVHSTVIVWAGYIRLLFKLPLKFRNVLQHTESRSSFACNQNIKQDIFTELKVLLSFKTKRNET